MPARDQMEERGSEVAIQQRVYARIHTGRDVAEPREGDYHVRRYVTRWRVSGAKQHLYATQAIDEVDAEERQPEHYEGSEDPYQSLLCSSFTSICFGRPTRR